jgi:hypothetical protein
MAHCKSHTYSDVTGFACACGSHEHDWLVVCDKQHYYSNAADCLYSLHYNLVCRNITGNWRYWTEVICPQLPFPFALKSIAKQKLYNNLNYRTLRQFICFYFFYFFKFICSWFYDAVSVAKTRGISVTEPFQKFFSEGCNLELRSAIFFSWHQYK